MSCSHRDADLLMLAHGELDRISAFRVRAHVVVCPACRARLRRFEALAGLIAVSYRNPVLGVRVLGRAPVRVWAGFGLVAALLTLLGWVVSSSAAASTPPAPAPKVGCPLHACRIHSGSKIPVPSNFSGHFCD